MFRFILTFLLASHIRSLQIDDFFPFGPSVGDSALFKNDDYIIFRNILFYFENNLLEFITRDFMLRPLNGPKHGVRHNA